MITIREALDADVKGIIDIYLATYGQDYAYPQYYDEIEIKKIRQLLDRKPRNSRK